MSSPGIYNLNAGYGQAQAAGIPYTTGKVFLVAGSANNNFNAIDGLYTPDAEGVARRYATIDAAINACSAGHGDVVLVAPGHSESITSATSLVADVNGVQIIGLGNGNNRPTLSFDNTARSIELDGANVLFKNFKLVASVSDVVVGINVDGNGCRVEDCEFNFDVSGDNFITMIDVDGVNNITLKNNFFRAQNTSGCAEAIRLDDCDDVTIEDNYVYGEFSDSAIVGEGAIGNGLLITRNNIYNSDTTAGNVIDLNVGFRGIISYNACGSLFATAPETTFDPGACLCIENYVVNAVDESGTLVPTTVST